MFGRSAANSLLAEVKWQCKYSIHLLDWIWQRVEEVQGKSLPGVFMYFPSFGPLSSLGFLPKMKMAFSRPASIFNSFFQTPRVRAIPP